LWQAGKNTGCFGLATITGTPEKIAVGPTETQYFKQLPTKGLRVLSRFMQAYQALILKPPKHSTRR